MNTNAPLARIAGEGGERSEPGEGHAASWIIAGVIERILATLRAA